MKNVWTITDRATIDRGSLPINWNIDLIEDITEKEAQNMAEKHEVIKGHDVYFIDFKQGWGYSYLVFLRGHHLRYAGDYELHHSGKTQEQLYKYYKRALNSKLYTEKGLAAKLKDYDDYKHRNYYLNNYYGDLENHISQFGNFNDKEYKAAYIKEIEGLVYNPVTFAYYENAAFVEKCKELQTEIESAKNTMNEDYEYWKKAFYYEFANHECIYGGNYAEAAYTATGGKALNNIQKKAYSVAMKEYEKYCLENGI